MSRTARADLRPIREPVQIPEPEHDVARALKELMHSLRQTMESEIRASGGTLSFAHYVLLTELAREPGLSGAQAARRAQVTAQTMNSLLRNLEAAGRVVREGNPENQRADRWFVTEEGIRSLERARIAGEGVMHRMLAPLSAHDAERLCELLKKCSAALQSGTGATEKASKDKEGARPAARSTSASRGSRGAP